MSPHDPSLRSLMGSLFEPNFLILVTYLAINLYLAFRVIRLATRRHGELRTTPPESGELGLLNEHGDMSFERCMQAHDTLFHPEQHRRHRRFDTRAADTLIRIATWAFKSDAARAKLLFCLLALLSLGSTWYYMIAFLRHSYASYLERCHLTGYLLPPEPPAFRLDAPHLLAPAVHLRLLRISQWLGSLSLFKEAWMEVIRDAPAWWWSSEICIVTVGAWALFLRHESKRLRMPHVWIVMALGQLVAISFALNLFQLAVVYRLDTRDLLAARADKVHKPKHRVIEPLDQSPSPSPEPSPEDDPDAGPFRVMMVGPERQRPYFASREGLPPTPRDSPDPDMRVISTNVTLQRKPLPPVPTLMDKVGRILQRCIPERIGLPVFVLAGLSSVLQHPDSFTKVMIMHLFPLLISLYPAYDQFGVAEHGPRSRPRSRFGSNVGHSPSPPPTMLLTKKQALRKLLARSNPDVRALQDPKTFYLGLGLASVVLRAWLTSSCFSQTKDDGWTLQRAWRTLKLLFPTTFLRHPAQGSISSDHVCVALSVAAFVLVESGVWLWKAARASPSAAWGEPWDFEPEIDDDAMDMPNPETLRLDEADRSWIETQARVVVGLLMLSPLLGGSATLSLYLALRCDWVEQDRRKRDRDDQNMLRGSPDRDRDGLELYEETEEVRLVENTEGERYVELRKIKIKVARPGHAAAAAREENEGGAAGGAAAGADTPPSDDGGWGAGADMTPPPEQPARRTPPVRHRHPPQRYGDD